MRSVLAVPLLREDRVLGVLVMSPQDARRVPASEVVALLQTFADQAVIAIENARLFAAAPGDEPRSCEVAASTSRSSWRTCPTSCGRR